MVSPKYVLLLPVRAVLYVLWLPYTLLLLVFAFLHKCIKRVVSVPVYYLGAVRARGRLVWTWTKSHARPSLPWWSRPCTATGTQTTDLEVVGIAALPAAGHILPEELPLALAASYEAASAVRRRRSRGSRQALYYLIDRLLQPNSPNGSDDEGEGPQRPPPRLALPSGKEEEEAEKALKLILDLVKLSKSREGIPLETSPQMSMLHSRQKASEIAALVRHARDRERLQSLIKELDQLATEVDPAVLLESERRARRKSRSRSAELLLSSEQDLFAKLGSHAETTGEEGEGEEEGGSETYSEEGSVSRGSTSESERTSAAEDDQFSPISPLSPVKLDEPVENRLIPDADARHGYRSVLSPVHESPELNRNSTSPESVFQLENDLDTALSQIDSEANDIRVNLEALESIERKIAQASRLSPASGSLTTRPNTSAAEPPSTWSEVDDKPVPAGTSGNVIWKSSIVVHRNRSDSGLSSIEDPQEEFPGIPHTDPSLGLREGHARRDLAIARSSSKRKLPTRKSAQESLSEHKPDQLGESAAVEQQLLEQDTEALDEEAPPRFNPRRLAGAIQVLPPITDQIKLLKPVEDEALPLSGTKPPSVSFESQTQTKRWYETDPEMPPETVRDPPETEEEKGRSHMGAFGISAPLRRRSSSDTGSEVQIPKPWESVPLPPPQQQQPQPLPQPLPQQPKKSLMIPSNQPPWIEMRKKNQMTPPPQLGTTPPKRSFLAATTYDVSPTKDTPTVPPITSPPLLDPPEYYQEEECIYDTLQPKPLFEGMALPPMRYLHQMVTPSQEQDVTASPNLPPRNQTRSSRSSSEEKDKKSRRRERSASSSTERTPSHESKSSSRHSRSEERGHRSSESSKKHRSSSSESSSSRHGSHSRSSERVSSHSTEKKPSSHSSDKHSLSSKSKESESKKKHSSSSSPSSSRKHSTSSSRAKESTSSKEESSRKRSSSRDKEESKSKAEGSKSSSKSKGESSRSSRSKAEKTPEKSSRSKTGSTSSPSSSSSSPSSKSSSSKTSPSSKSTSSKSSPPRISGATAKGELQKSTSLNSLSSVRSHSAVSTHSLRLDGKETEI